MIYTFSIYMYGGLLALASLFHSKAKKWHVGRINWEAQLQNAFKDNQDPVIWFHAASLGEFEQGRPVLEGIKAALSAKSQKHKILLTFFSPSGYEVRKDYKQADFVTYLPLDTPKNARKFLDLVNPAAVFFIKYEFWINFIKAIQQREIPLILFSALFRKEQIFFKPYGALWRNLLPKYTHIFVQNQASLDNLKSLHLGNISQVGDTRFDRVLENAQTHIHNAVVQQFKADKPLLVIGSCWGGDLDLLLPFLERINVPLKTVIAPHEIHENTLKRIEKALAGRTFRYSQARQVIGNDLDQYSVLIIDNVGLLAQIYAYADFAYVGGGFGEGLHNILEPAAFGVPVFFGEDYQDFPEAVALLEKKGAFSVKNRQELIPIFDRLYHSKALLEQVRQTNQSYVQENAHSTEKIIQFFFNEVFNKMVNY